MSKWLLRKASGSRARAKIKGDFADIRNSKKEDELEFLPKKESIRRNYTNVHKTYLDTTLIGRWLSSKVGQDFDSIYSEFLTRIQPKYLDQYRDSIFEFVERKENVEIKENGEVWGKWDGKPVQLPYYANGKFFVDPQSNKLQRLPKKRPTTSALGNDG